MARKEIAGQKVQVRPRLRVMWGNEIALGPGRVDLLELIYKTGSLRSAAHAMGISYMRAWNLIRYTNQCFSKPVVEAVRGGKTGGGASLTNTGREIIALYRRMENESQKAVKQPLARLKRLLKP